MPTPRALALALLLPVATAKAGIVIDGELAPGEWAGARHVTDFRQTEPWTGAPASLSTEAWVQATPEGLAVAFRAIQPPQVARTTQWLPRDFNAQVDRVNLVVDFNGDGFTGYNFTVSSTGSVFDGVITSESFDSDWDALWQHATAMDAEGWSVEMLIPWSTAPMHKARGDSRRIGIYLDRVVGVTGERDAWPMASFRHERFVSEFAIIEVPAYSQSLLALTPYVSALYDNIAGRGSGRAGVDIFWKPSGQFQLTATLNPDFGQVESDDLVVNFSATESYFSDKRSFFTENQSLFDFGLLSDNSALVYTRRVGGPADDGRGASDINAAIKLNGSLGRTHYGILAADERGDAGRGFGALRLVHDFGPQRLGALLTRVERPWLDRRATVLGLDHYWQPTAALTLGTKLVGSDVRQPGGAVRGGGVTFDGHYIMGNGWRQDWAAMHFDERLQVNDFGYLGRNDLDYLQWRIRKRLTELPADSAYTVHDWQLTLAAGNSAAAGLSLQRRARLGRHSRRRNGASEDIWLQINGAHRDDRLTRGHGALRLPPSLETGVSFDTPRHGAWALGLHVEVETGGLSGNHAVGWEAGLSPTLFISDRLRLQLGLGYEHTPDWLVWQRDALVGRFDQRTLELEAGFHWSISARQELRLKLQAIGLSARARGAVTVGTSGHALASDTPLADFGVRNFGLQLRYRYRLAPLSHLYVVYGRGGYRQDPYARASSDLLGRALGLRQGEQLLVKLNYRFGL